MMRRTFWSGLLSILSAPVWAKPKFMRGGKESTVASVTTITGADVSPASFVGGAADGTIVGAVTVNATGPAFSGTFEIDPTSPDASTFSLSSTSLPANLLTVGVLSAGTYSIRIIPTQAGAVNSGTAYPQVIIGSGAGTQIATFEIAETNGATSKGFKRFGIPLPFGAVPAGSVIKIQRGGADVPFQADGATYFSDGSLRFVVGKMRDADFSANEVRGYAIISYVGSFNNASTLTLADVTAASTFTLELTSITGATSGAISDMTASFDTMAATATRVTKYEEGPVCDSWLVWGLPTGTNHLVVEWEVTAWKDVAGAIVEIEYCAVPSQYFWSIAGKEKLTYTATLKSAGSTVQAYAGVQHVYRAQWATVRMQNDAQHGMRHWLTACPSLLYKPDKTHWVATRWAVGALDPTQTTWTNPYTGNSLTYVPGSAQSHRSGIDVGGAYAGRGVITNPDSIAFLTQNATDVRIARVSAFAGLHIPYHYRSNELRTRPGDGSADTAATIIPIILQDQRGAATPTSYYDFTADGMPAAQHASGWSGSSATFKAGYVTPAGDLTQTSGGTTWVLSGDATHAVSYSFFMYLLEGERHFMQATLDLAMNLAHQRLASTFGYNGVYPVHVMYGTGFGGAPTTAWTGIAIGNNQGGNERGNGWAALILGHAYATVPDNDVQAACFRKYHDHNMLFMGNSYGFMPQAQKDAGGYQAVVNGTTTTSVHLVSPWMTHFMTLGFLQDYFASRNATALAVGKDFGNLAVGQTEVRFGMANAYRALVVKKTKSAYNATTNPWPARGDTYLHGGVISIASSVFTCSRATYWDSLNYTNGDKVIFCGRNANDVIIATPAEISEGTVYFLVNVSGDTFQVAATAGGAPISFANYSGGAYIIAVQLQSADSVTDLRSQIVGVDADDRAPIARCALIAAHLAGNAAATQTLVDKMQTGLATPAPLDGTTWATWSYADPG